MTSAADIPAITIAATSPGGASRSSRSVRAAGWTAAAILLGMSAVHAYWATGGTWAMDPTFTPRSSAVVQYGVPAILLIGAAALLLACTGVLAVRVPEMLLQAGCWLLAAAFAFGGLTNMLTAHATFASDWQVYLFEPLQLVLAALCVIAAWAGHPRPHEAAMS